MFFKRLSVNLGVICTNDHLCFKIFLRHHMWTLYNSKHENSKTFLVLFFMKILQFCFGSTNSSLLLLFETEKPIWQPSSNVCTSRLILRSFLFGENIHFREKDRQTDRHTERGNKYRPGKWHFKFSTDKSKHKDKDRHM